MSSPVATIFLLLLGEENNLEPVPPDFYYWITNLGNLIITNTGDHIIFNKGT